MDLDQLSRIAGKPLSQKQRANALSFLMSLQRFGPVLGLDQPHREQQYLAQALHESGVFQWDREIWGPTQQQLRYDPASGSQLAIDLGNTQPGDGRRYYGRTGGMLTGRANYRAFTAWARKHIDPAAPDFEAEPDKVLTDPWEGLVPLWYWDSRNLNKYADQGDVENITLKINGGRNGFDDRLKWLGRCSLVRLGYGPAELAVFQRDARLKVDGIFGPKTRAAIHARLLALTVPASQPADAAAAPVVEEKPVAVTPAALDKPIEKTGGFWERIFTMGSAATGLGTLVFGDWKVTAISLGGVVVIAALGLVFHARIIAAVRDIKAAIAAPNGAA
ncbi:peptidoglycan-binding protein [Bosea minatitlanensis]|uniref:Peptidoglycan-binding protein n=1 Tax=Bosea minatitlanensis TaxID=128782 RepID=A0ABW0EYP1_9HYPH|nr:peptidoglycan-binding protein [Bosea minatitlanensis]MCT4495406.1 peptidoglycan-binding protein [Bosea minatitlanensis]